MILKSFALTVSLTRIIIIEETNFSSALVSFDE